MVYVAFLIYVSWYLVLQLLLAPLKELWGDELLQDAGGGGAAAAGAAAVAGGAGLQPGHEEDGGAGEPRRLLRQGLHVRLQRRPTLRGRHTLVSYSSFSSLNICRLSPSSVLFHIPYQKLLPDNCVRGWHWQTILPFLLVLFIAVSSSVSQIPLCRRMLAMEELLVGGQCTQASWHNLLWIPCTPIPSRSQH